MRFTLFQGDRLPALLLIAGGAAGLLLAALLCARRAARVATIAPGLAAMGHWLPVAAAALIAALLGQTEIAIGIVFGSSVMALSAAAGFILLVAPVGGTTPLAGRTWLFLPVPALLAFVVGLSGRVGPFEVLLLASQGAVMLMLWSGRSPRQGVDSPPAVPKAPVARPTALGILEIVAAVALAAVAAWAATRGAERLAWQDDCFPAGVIASALLGAVLGLPLAYSGSPLAAAGRSGDALCVNVGVVYLNLGALLPLAFGVPLALMVWGADGPAVAAVAELSPLVYPRIAWRIDALALLILSLLLVPAADNRLRLDGHIGLWLIAAYTIYIVAQAIAAAS